MKCMFRKTYEVSNAQEISIDWNGYNFLIIYGMHKNGWFIAIPNWNICTEASEPSDIFYNTQKLSEIILFNDAPGMFARAIYEHWSEINEKDSKDN